MRHDGTKKTIFLSIAGTILLILCAFSVFLTIRWREDPEVKSLLTESNRLITLGEGERAEGILEGLFRFDPNPRSILEYLRLHLCIASVSDDYGGLIRSSGRIIERFGDNPRFWEYRILAESRTGMHDIALQHCNTYLKGRRFIRSRTEVYLAAGLNTDRKKIPRDWRKIYGLLEEESPDLLMESWEIFHHPGLLNRAIVCTAVDKGTEAAFEMLHPDMLLYYPETAVTVAYDSRHFTEARDFLPRIGDDGKPEILLLKGDVYLRNRLFRSAGEVYAFCMERWPGFSYIPYNNLSRLYIGSPRALDICLRGIEQFPNDPGAKMVLIELYLTENREKEGFRELDEYMQMYPGDEYGRFLTEYLHGESLTPAVHTSRLWLRLDRQDMVREREAAYAAWYFGSSGQTEELRMLLERTETAYGERPWYLTCRGILYSMDGIYGEGKDFFVMAWEKDRMVENAYNAAVAAEKEAGSQAGLSYLTEALMYEDEFNGSPYADRIETKLAEVLFFQGNRTEALDHLERVINEHPGYLQARQLKKTILEGK